MAFARFGPDSDVYVYDTDRGFTCERCPGIGQSFDCITASEMVAHLQDHIQKGDKVPAEVLNELNQR